MFIAGLTGGIATGKSTVAGFLAQAGAAVIDADKIAHDVVRRGQGAWEKIVAHFSTAFCSLSLKMISPSRTLLISPSGSSTASPKCATIFSQAP